MSGRPDPDEISIEDAVDRWLRKRQTDSTEQTIRGYRSRLSQFVEWCIENDVQTVADLNGWLLDEYQLDLQDQGYAPTTVKGRLNTIRLWLEYLEVLDLVPEDISDAIDVPNLSKKQETNEGRLDPADAKDAIQFFRNSQRHYGTGMHAFLEIAWHVGARMGGIMGLDVGDFDFGEQSILFEHRPSTGTPLKNKTEGERYVGLSEEASNAVQFYVARERSDKRDRYGREPLFASRQGRASRTTLRAWAYQATQPCFWMDCPHGKSRRTCDWTQRSEASKCPSSRSPHRIRTGSITWQLNEGYPIELVAKRANVSIPVIKQHYDQAKSAEEFHERRRAAETELDIIPTES